MTKRAYLEFAIVSLFVAGCLEKKYTYTIEMRPAGGGIERKLTCTGNFSNAELERIAKLYESRIDHHTFSGRFDANLPSDIGGAGFYMSFVSNMGKTTVYSERLWGDDDLYVELNQMNQGVDQLIDFAVGWLEFELGNDPNFDELRQFCDTHLRQDCKNLSYYLWLERILSQYHDDVHQEFGMRAMHYLLERDYISQKELPLLSQGSENTALNIVRRIVAGKMGYSDPDVAAERLKFLSDANHFEKSLQRYIPTTDLYKNIWEAKKIEEADPNAGPPDTNEVFCAVLEKTGFDFDLFPPTYTIEVKLTCDTEPLGSNGRWDAEAHQVVWSVKIGKAPVSIINGPLWPTYFYSSSSTPDKKFQETLFGRTILSDEALARYCIWRDNLDEAKGKEWDSFVASLNPGEDLEGRLNNFRFAVDQQKKPDEEKSDLAQVPRELILAGLKSEEERKDDTETGVDEE